MDGATVRPNASPTRNVVYFFERSKLMAEQFYLQRPFSVSLKKSVPGSAVTPGPDDLWAVRGPGLVFSREETLKIRVQIRSGNVPVSQHVRGRDPH